MTSSYVLSLEDVQRNTLAVLDTVVATGRGSWAFGRLDGLGYEVMVTGTQGQEIQIGIYAHHDRTVSCIWGMLLDVLSVQSWRTLHAAVFHAQTIPRCSCHDGPETTCCRRLVTSVRRVFVLEGEMLSLKRDLRELKTRLQGLETIPDAVSRS